MDDKIYVGEDNETLEQTIERLEKQNIKYYNDIVCILTEDRNYQQQVYALNQEIESAQRWRLLYLLVNVVLILLLMFN